MVRLPHSPEAMERGRRLGALLRRARGNRSILDVASAARISPETLRKIETGRMVTPSFATVTAVASALDLSLDTLAAESSVTGVDPVDRLSV
ncbi:helix-turn-helix domain-containing protein [Agromyces sp. Marseille-Q5079]|uniref:helix-turn-helix domain-containing protein n=1 Tax=Agromyces sp. Marseille-Q5079 TaxID=3439059 RepID=UPI003D9CBA49